MPIVTETLISNKNMFGPKRNVQRGLAAPLAPLDRRGWNRRFGPRVYFTLTQVHDAGSQAHDTPQSEVLVQNRPSHEVDGPSGPTLSCLAVVKAIARKMVIRINMVNAGNFPLVILILFDLLSRKFFKSLARSGQLGTAS